MYMHVYVCNKSINRFAAVQLNVQLSYMICCCLPLKKLVARSCVNISFPSDAREVVHFRLIRLFSGRVTSAECCKSSLN